MRKYLFLLTSLSAASLMSGCSGASRSEDEIANNAVAAGFRPPILLERATFASQIDHRFARLDIDHDGSVPAADLPPRRRDRLMKYDFDHDGKLNTDEFTQADLALFDQADANHDGTLTTDERMAYMQAARAR